MRSNTQVFLDIRVESFLPNPQELLRNALQILIMEKKLTSDDNMYMHIYSPEEEIDVNYNGH